MAASNTVVSILSHSPASIGGMEAFARELSAQLAQLGWRSVFVYCGNPPEKVKSFLGICDLAVVEGCGTLAWRPICEVARLLREFRPRIVHLHFLSCPRAYAWLAKLRAVDKVFLTDHISRPVGWQAGRAALWKRAIGPVVNLPITKVFCVSSFVRSCWERRGMLDASRLAVVYNGVDVARAEIGLAARDDFRRRHSIPAGRLVVLQAGWLIPEKGADILLHAAKLVVGNNDRVHFVVAGAGPERRNLEKLANELAIASHVTFTGQIEDPFGEGLYAASDLVCQISRWEEAFGLTIAEAMASGRPVIATRVGGIPELIRDEESGYLVDRDDQAGVAQRILLLAEDPKLREAMGNTGREICRSTFDLARAISTLIRHYGIE